MDAAPRASFRASRHESDRPRVLDSSHLRSHATRAAQSRAGRGARARRLAIPPAALVPARAVPPPPRSYLPALAHAHRLWRPRRRPACRRHRSLCAVGGAPMSGGSRAPLEARLKAQAFGLGFDLAGICSLGPVETHDAFERWLDSGFAGEMEYLARGRDKRADSRLPVPGAVSAIVVAMS